MVFRRDRLRLPQLPTLSGRSASEKSGYLKIEDKSRMTWTTAGMNGMLCCHDGEQHLLCEALNISTVRSNSRAELVCATLLADALLFTERWYVLGASTIRHLTYVAAMLAFVTVATPYMITFNTHVRLPFHF